MPSRLSNLLPPLGGGFRSPQGDHDKEERYTPRTRRRNQRLCMCTVCSYTTQHKGYLTRHMRTHTSVKPMYACTVCNYKAAAKSSLAKHMRIHTGVKPYACDRCPYRAAQKSNLTVHMRTHDGERPFACTVCSYRSSRKGNLANHMRTHTGGLACPKCSLRQRKHHLTNHTDASKSRCHLKTQRHRGAGC